MMSQAKFLCFLNDSNLYCVWASCPGCLVGVLGEPKSRGWGGVNPNRRPTEGLLSSDGNISFYPFSDNLLQEF